MFSCEANFKDLKKRGIVRIELENVDSKDSSLEGIIVITDTAAIAEFMSILEITPRIDVDRINIQSGIFDLYLFDKNNSKTQMIIVDTFYSGAVLDYDGTWDATEIKQFFRNCKKEKIDHERNEQ